MYVPKGNVCTERECMYRKGMYVLKGNVCTERECLVSTSGSPGTEYVIVPTPWDWHKCVYQISGVHISRVNG
jgi:hypothetical protein